MRGAGREGSTASEGNAKIHFSVLATGLVVFIVSSVVTFSNIGFRADFVRRWLTAFIIGWPVASVTGLIAFPHTPRDSGHRRSDRARLMLSALDLARRIETGDLTPRAAVELCAEAIAARESEIGAFVALDLRAVRRAADDRSLAGKPLRGLPVAFKDIFNTADLPTQYGSPIYAGFQPRADATVVAMTKRAGGVVLGKTVTTETASMVPARTCNPHHPAHTPGGSSSGSAAAVAAAMAPIAFGTQTAGSVIAAGRLSCGVAGFKPSYRLIPLVGVKDVSWHLDTAGMFGAGVADVAFAAAVILGRDLRVDDGAPGVLYIALARTAQWPEASAAMQKAVETAGWIAEAAGAKLTDLTLPPIFGGAFAARLTIQDYGCSARCAFEFDRHPDLLDKSACVTRSQASGIVPGGAIMMQRAGSPAAPGRCSPIPWPITTCC